MNHVSRVVLSIMFSAVLSGCTPRDDTPRQTVGTAAPNVVSLTATEYALQAPDSIPAGWTVLRMANRGSEIHYGHMVRLDSGKNVQQMVDAYAEAIRTSGPRPKWVTRFGGPGGAAPGDSSSVTQFLEPGNYVWICPVEDNDGHPHFAKGEFKSFVVHPTSTPAASQAAAPEADMVVRLMDFSFALDTPVTAGRHTIRVENAGMQPHDLVLMKLVPGKTVEDIRTWMNPERPRRSDVPAEPPPPLDSLGTLIGGIASIGSGIESFFEADFTAGEYVLICMTTAPDGRSHIEHGMIQQISVR